MSSSSLTPENVALPQRNSFEYISRDIPSVYFFFHTTTLFNPSMYLPNSNSANTPLNPFSKSSSSSGGFSGSHSSLSFFGIYHNKSHSIHIVCVTTSSSSKDSSNNIKNAVNQFIKQLLQEKTLSENNFSKLQTNFLSPILYGLDGPPAIYCISSSSFQTACTHIQRYFYPTIFIYLFFLFRILNELMISNVYQPLKRNMLSNVVGGLNVGVNELKKGGKNKNLPHLEESIPMEKSSTSSFQSKLLIFLQTSNVSPSILLTIFPFLNLFPITIIPSNIGSSSFSSVLSSISHDKIKFFFCFFFLFFFLFSFFFFSKF
jgi:hypothetical protein